MSVIAEGVETIEQAEFLKSVGCYYIQGYLYARPVPGDDYLKMMDHRSCESKMKAIQKVANYNSEKFWDPKSIDTMIFNSFVGGASVFEYCEGNVEIIRTNDKYLQVLYGRQDTSDSPDMMNWMDYISEENYQKSLRAMREAIDTGNEVTDEMEILGIRENGRITYVRAVMRVIANTGNRYLFYSRLEDITVQKEAEKKKDSVSKQLHAIMKSMSGGVSACYHYDDGTDELLFANEQFYRQRGYTKRLYEEEVTQMLDIIHPEDQPKVRVLRQKRDQLGKPYSIIYRVIKRDKSIIWIKSNVTIAILEESTHPVHIAVSTDITREYQEEVRVKAEERLNHELLDNIPCGAGIFEYSQGKLHGIYLNRKYWELVGREPHELRENRTLDWVLLEDRAYLLKVMQKGILNGERMEGELHIKHQNGRYIPFHVEANAIRSKNRIITLYVTYTPITEESIVFRETLPYVLEAMMSFSTDYSFVKDRSLQYVCASKAFARMVGIKDEKEIIGKTDYDLFEKGYADKYREDDQLVIRSQKAMVDEMERIPSNDGYNHYSCTSKYLLKDSYGNITGLYGIGRDVTETLEANEKLRILTETMPGGIAKYEVSSAGIKRIYMTSGIYKLLGITEENKEQINSNPLANIVKTDLPDFLNQIELNRTEGRTINTTFRVIHADGGYRWINMICNETGKRGKLAEITAVLFDVTTKKEADIRLEAYERENKLKYERELKLRRELVKNAIYYYQINLSTGRIEEYNSIYQDAPLMKANITTDEVLRKSLLMNVKEEDREFVRNTIFIDALREAYRRDENTVTCEFRRLIPQSGYHWVRVEGTIIDRPNDDDMIAFLHCHDVDDGLLSQKTTEMIIREGTEAILYIKVQSGIGSVVHMRDNVNVLKIGKEFDVNTIFKEYCSKYVLDEDKEAFSNFFCLQKMQENLSTKKQASLVYQVVENNIHYRRVATLSYLENQRDVIVLTWRDITKIFEEEQQKNHKLEAANKANHAKSDFLSTMSHDIRTPLNAVLAFSNDELIGGADKRKLQDYLKRVNASGQYLLGLINDILDMSKIEQNKMKLNLEPYSIRKLAMNINTVIGELSKKKGIEFTIDISKDKNTGILADPIRTNQIMINLLSNAVKFTKSGGRVEFIVEEYENIQPRLVNKRFIIRDNGIGMSEEFKPHAFESFNQEVRKENIAGSVGTGLGLSIVKELTNLMGGTIQLESKINLGTTFTVEIPFEKAKERNVETSGDSIDYSKLTGAHILLAEDNIVNKEIAEALLSKRGGIVTYASDGKIACELFRKSEPGYFDLILMDIRMPVMDGLTASRKIRGMRRKDAGTIPIIAVTADAFSEDEQVAHKAGMNAHVSKPFAPLMLYETCCRYLPKK